MLVSGFVLVGAVGLPGTIRIAGLINLDGYTAAAGAKKMGIAHVIETLVHADHRSGGRALAAERMRDLLAGGPSTILAPALAGRRSVVGGGVEQEAEVVYTPHPMINPDIPTTAGRTAATSEPGTRFSAEFSYQDKRLGDTEPVVVATAPDVFRPTSTTVLLLRAARKALGEQHPRSVLDLGCGTGIVAVVLAKVLPADAVVCASDLSAAAVALAQHNGERNSVAVQCRSGNLFDPWRGQRFNLIVDDVSGVAEPLDRLSGWYPPAVPGGAGPDGTRWVLEVLDQAPDFLTPGGQLVFPVLTLSREQLVAERARSRFAAVEQVEEQWYPLNEQLLEYLPLLDQLTAAGRVRVEKRGSRWCWATKVYIACRH